MAAAAAAADPSVPGYFVGRPLHYQGQQPQAAAAAAAPAGDDHNAAVNAQVPGYYAGRVQQTRGDGAEHNNNNGDPAVPQGREPGFFAKLFGGCFSGSSGNAD